MGKNQTYNLYTKLPARDFWQHPPEVLFRQLASSPHGLGDETAKQRSKAALKNWRPRRPAWLNILYLFLGQFKNPLVLILVFAVGMSASLGDATNAVIIFSILLLTGILGFWQEYKADRAVKRLQARIHSTATVRRSGKLKKVRLENVAPGDVIRLAAGDITPGDCLLLTARDLHVNEATLTGESFPVEKHPGVCPAETALSRRTNALFQGSNIVNGEAEALVVHTGRETELGRIGERLRETTPETAFEKGVNRFGFLILRLTFLFAASILILNLFFDKPVVASILFSLALAVGMAPELLPAILATTLSAGAERMAKKKVIVKKLIAIQNLGAVNILCSDKTGTLTSGEVKVFATNGINNLPSPKTRLYAWLNAYYETGFSNPLDEALRKMEGLEPVGYVKLDEVPYDFIRKRLSIVVEKEGKHLMITKGALENVLEICQNAEDEDGHLTPVNQVSKSILENFGVHSAEGFRTIGVAWKDVTGDPVINKDDERGMTFLGFVFLYDPPKPGIEATIRSLERLGVELKVITGDNRLVARHTATLMGIKKPVLLTGADLRQISEEALPEKALKTNVFAEMEPYQKERLIRALRSREQVVGYLGDGINDANALRAADVGISVEGAVDVAKEASDLVLLEKDLDVLKEGILEGRKTYLNSLKYIFITTSANFGNMFSLAGISLFIPFLPMLPQQILLLNFLSDIPALGIASDRVDEEQLARPKRWNLGLIRRFMTVFGIQSSLFDYLTFALLLWVFHVDEAHFQSGWFVESVWTELLILLIIRTVRPAWRSRPSRFLTAATIAVAVATVAIPFLPVGALVGFQPLPWPLLGGMIGIALLYGILAETTKRQFFRRFQW